MTIYSMISTFADDFYTTVYVPFDESRYNDPDRHNMGWHTNDTPSVLDKYYGTSFQVRLLK